MSPRLVTFAHDRASIDAAVAAGADHLIFEDPRVSIRSWIQHSPDGWDYLGDLVQHARAARADVRISFNCDGLYRGAQMPVVEQAIAAAAFAGVDAIRVMDAGLRRRLNQLAPDCALELATEMGNCSIPCSAQYAREGFTYQVCTNDWPQADLLALAHENLLEQEILVHGPVLLQHSDRRQLSAHAHKHDATADPDTLAATPWHTVVIDGRPYPFADNSHGTVMYNTFDRSLLPYAEKLWQLQLRAWLIDGRGQAPAYTSTALTAFADLRARAELGDFTMAEAHWRAVQEQAERPLKPGFFLANNTDRIFADTVEDAKETVAVAEVLDVIRGDAVTLLVRQPFTAADHALRLRTPEGRTVTPNLQALTDVQGQGLSQARPGMLVRLPWQKGMVPTTILHAP